MGFYLNPCISILIVATVRRQPISAGPRLADTIRFQKRRSNDASGVELAARLCENLAAFESSLAAGHPRPETGF
jgi:hypothetical protein